ncbi:MAG: alpha/beta fold hydrolase [Candidatus Njordarchaeia archaeon]
MPYVNSDDGTKIFYTVEGDGQNVLFFVHGLGETHETWVDQIDYFKNKGFKVIALDLRGHGKSDIPKKKITMEDFAKDVLSVLKDTGISKANLVGYSMGALVVLEVLNLDKSVGDKIVLEAFVPQYPPAQTEVLINMSMDEIASQVAEYVVWRTAPQELKGDIKRIISETNKEVYIQSAEAATSKNYEPILTEIENQTLLVYGQFDFICPPEIGEKVKDRMKNAEMIVLDNVGHMPHREKPEEYNSALEKFLSK